MTQRVDAVADLDHAIALSSAAVVSGQCVVIPTDTVYGIGADATSAEAVSALLAAKGRGRDMPPPVLISEPGLLEALAADVPDNARNLAEAFWPGALTMILTAPESLRMDLGDTGGTIAVRVPDHEVARSLLQHTGPLAVSSANVSGQAPATTVGEAMEQLGESVAVYVDAGETPGTIPSTIVDFTRIETGEIVRLGVLSFEQLVDSAPGLRDAMAQDSGEQADESEDDTDSVAGHSDVGGSLDEAGLADAVTADESESQPSTADPHDVSEGDSPRA